MAEWDAQQKFHLTDIVDSGYRQFLVTPPIQGFHPGAYDWSFLHPVATLALLDGESSLLLPDDFGGAEGPLLISTTGVTGWRMNFGGIGDLYQAQNHSPTGTGLPLAACVEPIKGTTPLRGQRMRLRLWPAADQDYTLQFAYYLHPEALSDSSPYAYGGPQHSETILESCLAVAELRLDNVSRGPHAIAFMERLAASISQDRRLKAQDLGPNLDRSDGLAYRRPWRGLGQITYNGVLHE